MHKKFFSGACTALVTPMKDGKIDYKSLDRLIEFQIENGISAIVISGTTGESATLSYKEHKNLIAHSVKRAQNRTKIIAGTGSNDTAKAIKMSKYACGCGADALLVVSPYYNKANKEGIILHYEAIANESEKPIIIYNVPTRTCVNITGDIYRKLSKHKNICGIKEASSDISSVAQTINTCPLPLYSGNDDLLIPILSLGGAGVISVMSNIFPEISQSICTLYRNNKHSDALELYMKYLNFSKLLFSDVNPILIKTVMAHAKLCSDEMRLPLAKGDKAKIKAVIEEYEKLKQQ